MPCCPTPAALLRTSSSERRTGVTESAGSSDIFWARRVQTWSVLPWLSSRTACSASCCVWPSFWNRLTRRRLSSMFSTGAASEPFRLMRFSTCSWSSPQVRPFLLSAWSSILSISSSERPCSFRVSRRDSRSCSETFSSWRTAPWSTRAALAFFWLSATGLGGVGANTFTSGATSGASSWEAGAKASSWEATSGAFSVEQPDSCVISGALSMGASVVVRGAGAAIAAAGSCSGVVEAASMPPSRSSNADEAALASAGVAPEWARCSRARDSRLSGKICMACTPWPCTLQTLFHIFHTSEINGLRSSRSGGREFFSPRGEQAQARRARRRSTLSRARAKPCVE